MEDKEIYERLARMEAQIIAIKEAQVIFNQNLHEYKVQSNEWRGENQDLVTRFATNDKVDAKFMTIEKGDSKYVTKAEANTMFRSVMAGMLLLAGLVIALFTILT